MFPSFTLNTECTALLQVKTASHVHISQSLELLVLLLLLTIHCYSVNFTDRKEQNSHSLRQTRCTQKAVPRQKEDIAYALGTNKAYYQHQKYFA